MAGGGSDDGQHLVGSVGPVGYVGYRTVGPPGVHRGLPSPALTLIVTLDDPLVLAAHPDPRQPPDRYDTLIAGLHTTPALIRHEGRQSGVQIALPPLLARTLLGVPAGALAGLDAHLSDVAGPLAGRLRDRLLDVPGWTGRLAALDDVLRRALAAGQDRPAVPAEVTRACHVVARSRGRVRAADLARDVGWSPRRLLTAFRHDVGLSPKELARVTRFHHARRHLLATATAGRPLDLARLATGTGYYDQAHLAREFRALAGCPPSRLVAEELRFVQAPPGPDEAGSGS